MTRISWNDALVEQAVERPARQAVAEEAADHHEEEQQRERHHEVGEARDDCVDEAAEVAGERAEHDPIRIATSAAPAATSSETRPP